MLFASIIEDYIPNEDWVFCIDIDDATATFIRQQLEWLRANPVAVSCELVMGNERARLLFWEEYNELIVPNPDQLCGEDPLSYYRTIVGYGTPNQDYWGASYAQPGAVWLDLHENSIGFKFHKQAKILYANGLGEKDFFRDM